MKEVIESAFLITCLLLAGGKGLKEVHDRVRYAALEKVAKGLPSLTQMTQVTVSHRL